MRRFAAHHQTKAQNLAAYAAMLASMTDAALEACDPDSLARMFEVKPEKARQDLLRQKLMRSVRTDLTNV